MKSLICVLFVSLFLVFPVFADTVIIDNGDNATSFVGNWKVSGAEGYHGDNSVYCKEANATYTFESTVNGMQEIALWWTEWPSRADEVPVKIYDGDTLLDTVLVNQTAQGGQWNVLETYNFTENAKTVVVSEGGVHSTCADAVRFTDMVDVIVKTVIVEWEYEDAFVNEAGFTIRINEGMIIEVPGPDQRSWRGNVNLIQGINKFDMQTYDEEGHYSNWSDPAYYTPDREVVLFAPTDVTVTEEP